MSLLLITGTLDPERAGDGWDGAGDQHVRDHVENRGAEQDRKGGGETEG